MLNNADSHKTLSVCVCVLGQELKLPATNNSSCEGLGNVSDMFTKTDQWLISDSSSADGEHSAS